jgi:hypothetical protein
MFNRGSVGVRELGTGKETGLSIDIFAMANSHDLNGDNVLLDFVDDPVVIHAKAIGVLAPMQFLYSGRIGIRR